MLETLTPEEKFYVIGLFQGDGSLYENTRNRGKLQYNISIKDKDIIYKLYELFSKKVYCAIRTRVADTNFSKDFESIKFCIYNQDFRKELNKYIPYGKKDMLIKPPLGVSDTNAPHYIRGLFDADGSIGVTKDNRCFWSFCTKSEDVKNFIISHIKHTLNLTKTINRNKRDNIYNIMLVNEHAINYSDILYKDASIFINRKHKEYSLFTDWKRSVLKRKGTPKIWTVFEDEIILSEKYTLEEKQVLLDRTESSIKTRLWRLSISKS